MLSELSEQEVRYQFRSCVAAMNWECHMDVHGAVCWCVFVLIANVERLSLQSLTHLAERQSPPLLKNWFHDMMMWMSKSKAILVTGREDP
jgi:hypothetical protein